MKKLVLVFPLVSWAYIRSLSK